MGVGGGLVWDPPPPARPASLGFLGIWPVTTWPPYNPGSHLMALGCRFGPAEFRWKPEMIHDYIDLQLQESLETIKHTSLSLSSTWHCSQSYQNAPRYKRISRYLSRASICNEMRQAVATQLALSDPEVTSSHQSAKAVSLQ